MRTWELEQGLFLSLLVKAGVAAPEPGVCSGTLTTSESTPQNAR
jgi:hypothetical protein